MKNLWYSIKEVSNRLQKIKQKQRFSKGLFRAEQELDRSKNRK